jgi:hypothetical protein
MSGYTIKLEELSYDISLAAPEVNLALSRTGGQGSKGDSITNVETNSSGELVVTISNSVGNVVETINLGFLEVDTVLGNLRDVEVTSITDGQILQYDLATTTYVPHTLTTSSMTDVDNTGKTDGAVFLFDGTSNKYKATTQLNNANTSIIGGSF